MELITKPPKIPYRETITRLAEGHCRHKKQTGARGSSERCSPRRPFPAARLRVRRQGEGRRDPNVFIAAVEKGVRMALDTGVIAGYPVHDIRVTVYDASTTPWTRGSRVLSAGRKAIIDAFSKAGAIVSRPIVNIEIAAPDKFMGDLTSDLSASAGR